MYRRRCCGPTRRRATGGRRRAAPKVSYDNAVDALMGAGAYYRRPRPALAGRGAYRRPRIRGRGGFFSDIWDGVRSVAQFVAKNAEPVGRVAKSISGMGAYGAPGKLYEGTDPPSIQNGPRANIFRHREYIGDIVTSSSAGAFQNNTFAINPGMPATFPWLSSLASNYEEWAPRGVVFEFKSTSADALNSTNTALGLVIGCTQYNAGSASFANQQQMENYEGSIGGRQSGSLFFPVECSPKTLPYKRMYVRHGAVPSGQDARLYDMGTFNLATYGGQAASVTIGQLWLSYELELFVPKLVGGGGSLVLSDSYSATAGITTTHYFGTSQTADANNSIGTVLAGTTITFPTFVDIGKYQITYYCFGTSAAWTAPVITATSGCTKTLDLGNTGGTGSYCWAAATIAVTAAGPVVTFSGATLPTTPTQMYLIITQLDNDLTKV